MELKTVQTLDELEVTKPCIDMTDEGYNCEWSQELKLEQSFNEYLNAWIILHILKDKFGWGQPDSRGFIFNMSVGYNLEGILNPNVQNFLDKMTDCGAEKAVKGFRNSRQDYG
jgi:putative selenate reductase